MFSRVLKNSSLLVFLSCILAAPAEVFAQRPKGGETASAVEFAAITPKAEEALHKALKLLTPYMTSKEQESAKQHLQTAFQIAPTNADVNYVLGVYSWHTDDRAGAISYWRKAVEYYPEHYRALVSLGQALVDENRPNEALPYLERATQAEPYSWRPYVLAAHVYLRQGLPDEAAKLAERAVELGGNEAAIAQRYLAAALAKRGENERAARVLDSYLRKHPKDTDAKSQLERLQGLSGQNAQEAAEKSGEELLDTRAIMSVTPLPLAPSRWLPPDIDDNVPAVDTTTTCALNDVLPKTESRVQEFIKNVDRYTASEFLNHKSIDKWGFLESMEARKFDYVVSIGEIMPGVLNVEEYRGIGSSLGDFPGGVATLGLPALALIFHPYNVDNFEMSCEGLAPWNGGLAWQIHFRQMPGKPNNMRRYRIGLNGPSYAVALKGRAWINAENFQIARIETDLVAPIPEILLFADHTAIEYGPVHFRDRNVEMWLPQNAEVYFDWRGRRTHRRHSFSNYFLYSVDEKQNISPPKQQADQKPAD